MPLLSVRRAFRQEPKRSETSKQSLLLKVYRRRDLGGEAASIADPHSNQTPGYPHLQPAPNMHHNVIVSNLVTVFRWIVKAKFDAL
eukprot:1363177-Amphidinium_carterae.1